MSVLGIVAEYNPFHNGHLAHLNAAVSSVAPSAVLVALSGPFTQRGEPALLSPFRRAECALYAGADAVFALPVCWTVRDAEHYALGAVSMLSSLGATHLAFGAETPNLSLLQRTADLLEDSPVPLQETLRALLDHGRGYPYALSEAVGTCLPEGGLLLRRSNNILAVCYLRAIQRLGLSLTPVVIPRHGGYRSDRIDPDCPSASAIRDALSRGSWQNALSALPEMSAAAVRSAFLSGCLPDPAYLDALLLARLRGLSLTEAALLPDCPEGLDTALLKAAATAGSRSELLEQLTTRRYPSARISRLCACALLGITREDLDCLPLPDTALLLAIRKNPVMTERWKNAGIQVLTAPEWQKTTARPELEAWRLWALCCRMPGSFPFSERLPVIR